MLDNASPRDRDLRRNALPEEMAVALSFDGSVQAVMMATPGDLEDFIAGFALTEGITRRCPEPEIVAHGDGIDLRVWLDPADGHRLARRRRTMAGPVGCGLCGIDSLSEALRRPPRVEADLSLPVTDLRRAEAALRRAQPLRDRTGAVHGAGFWQPGRGLLLVREDVGRHNALDKLAGALVRSGIAASGGAVIVTSRVSVDLVQKTAMIGASVLLSLGSPTTLAVATADAAGLTLVTGAGSVAPNLHTHTHRIID